MATVTQGDAADLRRALNTTRILVGSMIAAVAAYVAIGLYLRSEGLIPLVADDHERREGAQWVILALGMAAAACAVGGPLLGGILIGRVEARLGPEATEDLQGRVRAWTQAFQTATIARAALAEAVAVFGLVLFALYGTRALFFGFAAIALVGLARAWPTWGRMTRGLTAVAPEFPGWDRPPPRRRPDGGSA